MSNDEPTRDPILSRAYRQGAKAEPPAALDASILAAARQAAAPAPAPRVPWWRRAMAPVGVLATVAVTVSVVLMVEQEQHDLLPEAAPAPAPVQVPAAAEPALPEPEPVESDRAGATAELKRERRSMVPAKPDRSSAAPAAPATAPATAPAPAPVPAPAPAPESASAPAMSEGAPPPEADGIDLKQESRSRALAKPSRSPAASRFGSVPAGGLDGELREAPAQPESPADGAAMKRKALPAEKAPVPPSPAPGAAPSAVPSYGTGADLPEAAKAPADWLEEIRRLHRAGRDAEAQAQLAAFRRTYPDYPLPDDLKGLQAP